MEILKPEKNMLQKHVIELKRANLDLKKGGYCVFGFIYFLLFSLYVQLT